MKMPSTNDRKMRPAEHPVTTDMLAAKYQKLTRNSAENIIELGKTVCEAKALGDEPLIQFCKIVNLNPAGSTYRKHLVIGSNAERFSPHIDRMPASWTTIYKLACLDDDEFDKVVANTDFSPVITAKTLAEILGRTSDDRSRQPDRDVTITLDLRALSDDDRRNVYYEVESLRESHEFKVHVSAAMREVVGETRSDRSGDRAFRLEQAV